jgi:hypothetical protein
MDADAPDYLAYSEVLSPYIPKIAASQSREEAATLAIAFLSAADGLLDAAAKQAYHDEEEYLWTTFPQQAKTIENYQKLVQVLLAQAVDFHWYARYPRYGSNHDVDGDDKLCCFKRGSADFEVKFDYVQYYGHVLMRIPNSLRLRYRRFVNHPGRYTQGLGTTRCKKAMVGLINQISEDVAGEVTSSRPFKVMVNSILRTETYQNTLAGIGYIAPRHSAHLAGYAVDVEKLWYEMHDRRTHAAIADTLAGLFKNRVVNLIEEETHWHVCLNPAHIHYFENLSHKWARKRP